MSTQDALSLNFVTPKPAGAYDSLLTCGAKESCNRKTTLAQRFKVHLTKSLERAKVKLELAVKVF